MKFTLLLILLISNNVYSSLHTCPKMLQLKHSYYETCYNTTIRLASWTSYTLTADMLSGTTPRSNRFEIDPLVTDTNAHIYPEEYKNTSYDRGHLVPAADMRMNTLSMSESFYMTNITAQEPSFNRGIWKKIENQVRRIALIEKEIIIVSGPIFKFKKKLNKTLKIPVAFYKIIFKNDPVKPKMIAFLLKNEKSKKPISDFITNVDTIEKLTQIDFFSKLPTKIQNQLEAYTHPDEWPLH